MVPNREMTLEEISLFVGLVDSGAGPKEYYRHFGFENEHILYHLGRISGYREILDEGMRDVRACDVEFARQFVCLVDAGAGLRAFRKIGIAGREDFNCHLAKLDLYRKAIKLAAGIRVDVAERKAIRVYSPNFVVLNSGAKKDACNCTAIVIGTTVRDRQSRFRQVIEAFNNKDEGILSAKIVSIDDFGDGVDEDFLKFLSESGWEVIVAKRRGMVKSQRDALSKVDTEWVLYCEDDAVPHKLPDATDMETITNVEVNGRRCGILSFMCGGYELGRYGHEIDAELREPTSFIPLCNGEDAAWVRTDRFRNNWYVEFPISMMRAQLMKNCSDYIMNRNLPYQIEHGFTVAWFEMGYDKHYFKASYLKHPKSQKPLGEYSYHDIQNTFINQHLMHARLLGGYTLDAGHNFSEVL